MLEILLDHTLRTLPVYACAAMGGILAERSGVVHLGLEGIVLSSALAASMAALATGSFVLAGVAALGTGLLLGTLHGYASTRGRVDDVVSGLALNLAAFAATRAVLRGTYGSSSNSPSFEGGPPALVLWPALVLLVTAATWWILQRTRFGIALRAAGSAPEAARSAGLDVAKMRIVAVALGSGLTGLAGLALAYDQHQFQAGMSGGRGFVALVIGIVSRRRPTIALGSSVAFALLEALDAALQGNVPVPSELLSALPYLATLVALAVAGRRRALPA